MTPGHTINLLKLTDPKQDRVLNCIVDLNWDIKEFIFHNPRSQWTLPQRLDFEEIELELDTFIMTNQDDLYRLHEDDEYIMLPTHNSTDSYLVLTAYKCVGKKIHPVSTQFPTDCQVTCQIPEDPLLTLPSLPTQPPDFTPITKISMECKMELNINATGFCDET